MNAPLKMDLFDAQQGLSFLISQASHIEREVYEIQYPDIQYQDLIPVDTSANEWARTVTYISTDKVGEAGWINHSAADVPYADTERSEFETSVHIAAIGYEYTLEEVNQAIRDRLDLSKLTIVKGGDFANKRTTIG